MLNEAEPVVVQTPEQMVEEYVALSERVQTLSKEVGDLNAQIAPLSQAREKKTVEFHRAEKRRQALRENFKAATGWDIRKHLRGPQQEAIDRAQGALVHAVLDPGNLPVDHPIVLARLAEWRDAIAAARKAREQKNPTGSPATE